MINRTWVFRVSCKVDPGEKVYVVGSCDILGNWDSQRALPLEPDDPHDLLKTDTEIAWKAVVNLPNQEVEYRYCICLCSKFKKNEGPDDFIFIVKRWETNLQPRHIAIDVSNEVDPEFHTFGCIGEFKRNDQGWLVKESLVQLRLCSSTLYNDPVILWKRKHKNKNCYVKVTPVDITKNSSVEPFLEGPVDADESTEVDITDLRIGSRSSCSAVEVSILKEGLTEFHNQDQFGVPCNSEDFIVFQCRMADPQSIAYLMDYYVELRMDEDPHYVGCSFVLPSNLKENSGVANLPITSQKHVPIGQITVHYMVIHPLKEYECDMEVSYARHWKDSWRGLEVGHRGAGNSYHSQTKNCANIRENTIASLIHATESGADMVEFDVQLSKDLIPLLYHDFHTCIALKFKKESETQNTDLMEIPIKDLTLNQLQALKVYHKTEKGLSRFSDEDFEDHQPFPTLEKALNFVPDSCGFNIEIKWTMRYKDGTYALEHPLELNRFIDIILKVVLENSTSRKIIFSCFHPDICTMIRLKQNRYPVLFLTQGESIRWPTYDDMRTSSIQQAIFFASSANILGINVYTEELLRDSDKIQMAFDHNLIVFCWGDQNSDRDTIESLKKLGLHGIIYDKIDVYNTKGKKSSVFVCDDRDTCRCLPSSGKISKNSDGNKTRLAPSFEIGVGASTTIIENSPSNGECKKCLTADALTNDEQPLKETGIKRKGSPPSFHGILSKDINMGNNC